MEIGTYKNNFGHELRVVEIDNEGKRVRVDYGNGHFHWWGESDYVTWEKADAQPLPTTTSDTQSVTIETTEPEPPKKRGRKKAT